MKTIFSFFARRRTTGYEPFEATDEGSRGFCFAPGGGAWDATKLAKRTVSVPKRRRRVEGHGSRVPELQGEECERGEKETEMCGHQNSARVPLSSSHQSGRKSP